MEELSGETGMSNMCIGFSCKAPTSSDESQRNQSDNSGCSAVFAT
jgi:hypothetical protein